MALWRWWESRREVERRQGAREHLDALHRIEARRLHPAGSGR